MLESLLHATIFKFTILCTALLVVRLVVLLRKIRRQRLPTVSRVTTTQLRGSGTKTEKSNKNRSVLENAHNNTNAFHKRTTPVKTLLVLGSGGHTSELLYLTKHLDPTWYQPIIYVKAQSDVTSVMRLPKQSTEVTNNNTIDSSKFAIQNEHVVYNIPRSREVGQSYFTSIFTSLYAQFCAFVLVVQLKPDLILCNGPGTCLPICLAAMTMRLLFIRSTRIVFCESYCRVNTLSLTGKLLYHWVDLFLVHWPELAQKYPLTKLSSSFINHNDDNINKSSNSKSSNDESSLDDNGNANISKDKAQ